MQRRQLIKLILPVAALSAGAGVVIGRKLLSASCVALDLAALLIRLKPFSDSELGKKANAESPFDSAQGALAERLVMSEAELSRSLKRFDTFCEQDFNQRFRQLVAEDFAQGKTANIDGSIGVSFDLC